MGEFEFLKIFTFDEHYDKYTEFSYMPVQTIIIFCKLD